MATSRQASSSVVHVLVRQGLIPPVTADQFTFRLNRLVSSFRARGHDIEELEQELLVVLVRALNRYRPGRVPFRAFLKAALNCGYCDMCRRLKAECRRRVRNHPIGDEMPERHNLASFDQEVLERAWRSLSDEDRELAQQLAVVSPAQIARLRGVHRGTVLRDAQRLGWAFRGVVE